jgi:cell wall-associated NlpC family hydrolase
MIQEVNDTLAAVLEARGLDARGCFTRVAALPPDGGTVELECSDASVADDVVHRLHLSAADARRLRVTILPRADVPTEMIVSSSVADVRRSPSHPSELVSQAVMGDRVLPLKADGEWFLVLMEDGYIGWIRSWHLLETTPAVRDAFQARALHRIAVNTSEALSGPGADTLPVSDLVIGTPVVAPAPATRGWVAVELPDGRAGFVREGHLESRPAGRSVSPEGLVATGLRFLGIPYLWGGSTPKGFDCSGLVQRIFRLHGLVLPRDSDQQAHFGREKRAPELDELVPGDLLFFGRASQRITHVAMVLPNREFLHAYGQVRVNSLDPKHPQFEPSLARDWRGTRDPLAQAQKNA